MRLVQSSTIINGAYADTALSWAAMRAVNWLPEAAEADGTRTPRKYATPPGLRLLVDLQTRAPVRGLEDVEGRLFAVSGDSLFEIANDLTVTNRGSIPGVGRVSMAHNQQGGASDANELAIANGLSGYVYNTDTTVLTQITDSAFEGATTFDYVDGYMSYTDPQGRWWGHSDLNQALQYSSIDRNDAESAPDKIVSHIVSHREVIVWGSRTGEFFRNTGAATGTFQRVDGTEMEVGICATFARARVDNTVCWVGNDLTVYRLNGHAPQRVSTRPIEQLLSSVDPTTIFCYTWEDRGHKVFYVTSPNNFTVGLDFASGLWHARESYGLDQWRINALVRWGTRWIAGDYVNGLLYELDWDWYTENGRPMVSQCATGYTWAEQNKLLCPYVELIFDTGGAGGVGYGEAEALGLSGDVPDGYVDDVVDTSYVATGGVQPYTFEILSGTFPAGLTLNANTGAVTGAFTAPGSYSWVVRVIDDDGEVATVNDSSEVAQGWMATYTGGSIKISPDGNDWSAAGSKPSDGSGIIWSPILGGNLVRATNGDILASCTAVEGGTAAVNVALRSAAGGWTRSTYAGTISGSGGETIYTGTHYFMTGGTTIGESKISSTGANFTNIASLRCDAAALGDSFVIGTGGYFGSLETTKIALDGTSFSAGTSIATGNTLAQRGADSDSTSRVCFAGVLGGAGQIGIYSTDDDAATWSTHTNPFPAGHGLTFTSNVRVHYGLGRWFVFAGTRVAHGLTLDTLALDSYVFPQAVNNADSDGEKLIVCGNSGMLQKWTLAAGWSALTSGMATTVFDVVLIPESP